MTIICVTGTPGCGKTYYSKKIAKAINFEYVDVKKIIFENKLDKEYDSLKKCYVIDIKKLNSILMKLKGNLIIDSHLSHYLPKKFVTFVIVVKCDISKLKKRLQKRKYSVKKIRENLDCEIMDVCLTESIEIGHKVFVIETKEDFLRLMKDKIGKFKTNSKSKLKKRKVFLK